MVTYKNKKHFISVPYSPIVVGAKYFKSLLLSVGMVAFGVIITSLASSYDRASAAPFPTCESRGMLFQYPGAAPTAVHEIDMVTGDDIEPPGTPIPNRQINAIGYNIQDNYIYGWDNATGQMVQIQDDWTATPIGKPNGYAGNTTAIYIGDVDSNGDYWFAGGGSWYQVDLTPGPTYKNILASGPINQPANTGVLGDWAFIPGKSDLYTVMNDATVNQARLWIFNRTSHTWSSPGLLPAITPHTPLTEGAMYTDSQGFLYASVNTTGDIWRIDVNATTAALLSNGDPSANNDGARCAIAPLSIDFGDGPFITLLADGGPRHEVIGYDSVSHTAPLMLGKTVDTESDGFPGAAATGDDLNDIDDEDAVTPIIAASGAPTALSIPVTVTNNNSESATLAGWVDLNNNATFEPSERVIHSIPANSGTVSYELVFPTATFTTNTHARFRVFESTIANPQPVGPATAGETEDHLVQVGSYTIKKSSTPISGTTVSNGDTLTYTLNVTNTGLTDLVGLSFYDDLSDVLNSASMQNNPTVSPASIGTAIVTNNTMQVALTNTLLAGQSATISYSVKVKDAADPASPVLRNTVIAAHSNCHPDINGQTITVADSDCKTEHPIAMGDQAYGGLAKTGRSIMIPVLLAGGLIVVAFGLLKKYS